MLLFLESFKIPLIHSLFLYDRMTIENQIIGVEMMVMMIMMRKKVVAEEEIVGGIVKEMKVIHQTDMTIKMITEKDRSMIHLFQILW